MTAVEKKDCTVAKINTSMTQLHESSWDKDIGHTDTIRTGALIKFTDEHLKEDSIGCQNVTTFVKIISENRIVFSLLINRKLIKN